LDQDVIMALLSMVVASAMGVMGFILSRQWSSIARAHERVDQMGTDLAAMYVRRDGIQPTLERIEVELRTQREMHVKLMADTSKALSDVALAVSGLNLSNKK
jgi:hypothetical protein